MLRFKLIKLKQVCATALLPRIFKDARKKINACSLEQLAKVTKSTDSGSKDDKQEKQLGTIEKRISDKISDIDSKSVEDIKAKDEEFLNVEKIPLNSFAAENKLDKSVTHYSDSEDDKNKPIKTKDITGDVSEVRATTAKVEEEKLTQKIDQIDEIPHVEAGPTKIEGFNVNPRVIGHEEPKLNSYEQEDIQTNTNEKEQVDLESLAKRCLGTPTGDFDTALLNELKNISNKDLQILNIDLSNNKSAEKYFSQILERSKPQEVLPESPKTDLAPEGVDSSKEQTQKNLHEKTGIDKESRKDDFQPLYLDTVPIFTVDNSRRCYDDDDVLVKNLTLPDNKQVVDMPTVLHPYDMRAIPFYGYENKETDETEKSMDSETTVMEQSKMPEHSLIDNSDTLLNIHLKEDTIINPKTTQTDIPVNEDIIVNKDDLNEPLVGQKVQEVDCEAPQQSINSAIEEKAENSTVTLKQSYLSEADVSKLLEYKNVLSLRPDNSNDEKVLATGSSQEVNPPRETENQTETSTSETSSTHPLQNKQQNKVHIPENTAISANQNPGEYYECSSDYKSYSELCNEEPQSILSDTVSQSMVFSTMPQYVETEEVENPEGSTIKPEHLFFYPNDLVLKPDSKQTEIVNTNKDVIKGSGVCAEDSLPLSLLWKRLVERNRAAFNDSVCCCRAKPETASSRPCNPPLDKSKPKTTLHPEHCKPKPKPPESAPCPEPPKKKDPCAKFVALFISTLINTNSSVDLMSLFRQDFKEQKFTNPSSMAVLVDNTVGKLKYVNQILEFLIKTRDVDKTKEILGVVCARNFDPWVPIPSWPIPKKEKRSPLVCPKDGCKLPAPIKVTPNLNRPCLGVPKKVSPTKTL